MGRFLALLLVLGAAASPAQAEEAPDCTVWAIKGIRPGMSLEEARGDRIFNEFQKFRDPVGYRRYIWWATGKPEKIDLHVDVASDPTRVVGVMTTIPSEEIPPRKYLEQLLERWGRPFNVSRQGAFDLYTWTSQECDVDARATVMNQQHEVGVFVAVASISGRAEVVRRKREAKAAEGAAGAAADDATAGQAPAPDTPGGDE